MPTFERLRYKNVYPGIDVVFYGTDRQLEYDFVVAPHADPAAIALTFRGADSIRAGAGGDLIVSAAGRGMMHKLPAAYQDRGGRRVPVAASYAIASDGAVTFELGDYDRSSPLTIDPMIVLSRFLGGTDSDIAKRVVARNGFVYLAGETCSADFPTQGAFQNARSGVCDAFISKFSGDGTQLVYSTYLGGSNTDYANGLAVDASGAIYVAGYTGSIDFPTTPGAFDRTCDNGCVQNGFAAGDGFVTKIASSGSSLVYSTYIGGSGTDFFNFLAVNAAGEAVVTGESASTDYPTTPGTPQRSLNGIRDAVVTKVSTDGSSLVYSTYFGGSGFTETGLGVAYDASGNAWAVGQTDSANLPVLGAFQPSLAGGIDGFVVELTPTGSLAFSSYFGGDGNDQLFGVAPDATGIYVIGSSRSTLLPGQSIARDVGATAQAAVVAQIAANGSHVIRSQLIDGSASETGSHLIVTHPSGSTTLVHAIGWTGSNDFPVTSDAWQKAPAQNTSGPFDLFYATLPLDGSGALAAPSFATILGGNGVELFPDLSSDGSDGVFLLTATDSTFPRINAAPGSKTTDAILVHVVPPARWTESTAGEVHLYAADANAVGADWSLVADPTAADGRRAANVDRAAPKVTVPLSSPASYTEWKFDADPGAYRVWIRGIAAANSYNNDSVYVQFSDTVDTSGNPIWRIGSTSATAVILEDCTGCGVHGWGWNDNGYGAGVLGPLVRFGTTTTHHVMRIQAREDGLSIDQIVLTKAQYLNAAPGATKDDVTVLKRTSAVTPPPPPPPPPGDCTVGETVIYASTVEHATGWTVTSDPTAAGGARLFNPDAGAPKATSPQPGLAFFDTDFQADANVDYHLWIRGKAQNDFWGNDSVFVQFSDAVDASGNPIWQINTSSATSVNLEDCSGCGEKAWGWQDNGYGAGVMGPAVRFSDPRGTHTIKITTREDGFSIDQIVLSSAKYLSAAPGTLKNDATILPACPQPPLR